MQLWRENASRKDWRRLWRENPKLIKEVRGLGLMIGMEYNYEFVGALMAECLAANGIWAAYSGNAPQVMRFQIPITVTMEEVEDMLVRIRQSVKDMRKYLIPLLPLARFSMFRKLLDNLHIQIVAFNLMRDIEEFIMIKILRRS
jgi:hypothetical protein